MKKLGQKPFALIGVNTNISDSKTLKETMDREKLNWRSFAIQDSINDAWNKPGTPMYYLLDPKGVIRYKWFGSPGEKAIDSAIDLMIEAAEKMGGRVRKPQD